MKIKTLPTYAIIAAILILAATAPSRACGVQTTSTTTAGATTTAPAGGGGLLDRA